VQPLPTRPQGSVQARRSALLSGLLVGIGVVGFIDETVFHQLLQWHAFYWATSQHGRVLSDGLFHAFSTALLIWGAVRLWRDRESWTQVRSREIAAAALIGGGLFNFYDGVVQHVIFHLHLVNEKVCPHPQADNSVSTCHRDIPFEVLWIVAGAALVAAGVIWWKRLGRAADHALPIGSKASV
jgi:uncharacterized membrane protein